MPRGGEIFARAPRAQDSIFLPPLANFSCTPLIRECEDEVDNQSEKIEDEVESTGSQALMKTMMKLRIF